MADKSFGFQMKTMVKHPSLIPVVGFCGLGCVLSAAYIGYMLARKPDYSVKGKLYGTGQAPWAEVKYGEIRKLMDYHTGNLPPADPQVEQLKLDINKAYSA